jgi:hypothetical protein
MTIAGNNPRPMGKLYAHAVEFEWLQLVQRLKKHTTITHKCTAVLIALHSYTTSQNHENCRTTEAHQAKGAKEMNIITAKFSIFQIFEGLEYNRG